MWQSWCERFCNGVGVANHSLAGFSSHVHSSVTFLITWTFTINPTWASSLIHRFISHLVHWWLYPQFKMTHMFSVIGNFFLLMSLSTSLFFRTPAPTNFSPQWNWCYTQIKSPPSILYLCTTKYSFCYYFPLPQQRYIIKCDHAHETNNHVHGLQSSKTFIHLKKTHCNKGLIPFPNVYSSEADTETISLVYSPLPLGKFSHPWSPLQSSETPSSVAHNTACLRALPLPCS